MIMGIGTDLCAISRIERVLAKHGARFIARVAGADADAQQPFSAPKLARRWALKEAVAKALGTGIGARLGFAEIVVGHTPGGAVRVALPGHPGLVCHASVADDGAYAVAFVVLEKNQNPSA